jgi:hypothetical protein
MVAQKLDCPLIENTDSPIEIGRDAWQLPLFPGPAGAPCTLRSQSAMLALFISFAAEQLTPSPS